MQAEPVMGAHMSVHAMPLAAGSALLDGCNSGPGIRERALHALHGLGAGDHQRHATRTASACTDGSTPQDDFSRAFTTAPVVDRVAVIEASGAHARL